jgi:hypothetical protein
LCGWFSLTFGEKERMNFYSYDPESDKITRVKGEVNKAKSVMMENIDKACPNIGRLLLIFFAFAR